MSKTRKYLHFFFPLRPPKNSTVEVRGGSPMLGTEYLKNALKEFRLNLSEYTLK